LRVRLGLRTWLRRRGIKPEIPDLWRGLGADILTACGRDNRRMSDNHQAQGKAFLQHGLRQA
ncbi:MAG: hypothetical protein WBO41_07155, partial [Sphingorhabdus sp.]